MSKLYIRDKNGNLVPVESISTGGGGITVIRESNVYVEEEAGTVLETKLTRAEFAAAAAGGMELHILSDDGIDWYIYKLIDFTISGDWAVFSKCDSWTNKTIYIDIAEDGTMTVSDVISKEIKDGTIYKWIADGNYTDGTTIPLAGNLADYDLIEIHVKDTYGNTGVLHGKYTRGDYAGGGVTAIGGVYSSGGYIYFATVSITASGRLYFPPMFSASVGSGVSWGTASSGTRYVTRIVGYKFG